MEPELRPILTTSGGQYQPGGLVVTKSNDTKGRQVEVTVILGTLSCFANNTSFPVLEEGKETTSHFKKWEKTTRSIAGKSSSHSRNRGGGLS